MRFIFCLKRLVVISTMGLLSFAVHSAYSQDLPVRNDALPADEETSREAFSYLEASLGNERSIRNGDLLLRTQSNFDTVNVAEFNPNGIVIDSVTLQRIRFNHETQQYCVLTYNLTKSLDLSETESEDIPADKQTVSMSGYVIDGQQEVFLERIFPNDQLTHAFDGGRYSVERLCKQVNFPDLRTFAFGCTTYHGNLEATEAFVTRLAARNRLISMTESRDGIQEMKFRLTKPDAESQEALTLEFDTELFTPVKYYIDYWLPDGQMSRGAICKTTPMIFRGLTLPAKAEKNTGALFRLNGREHTGIEIKTYGFHWFSVNGEFPEDAFAGKELQDLNAFMDGVDPNRAGAKSLLDK